MSRKLKPGDIVENLWMGETNHLRKSIYVKDCLIGVDKDNQLHFQRIDDLWKKEIETDTEHYWVVGHVDIVGEIKKMIENA